MKQIGHLCERRKQATYSIHFSSTFMLILRSTNLVCDQLTPEAALFLPDDYHETREFHETLVLSLLVASAHSRQQALCTTHSARSNVLLMASRIIFRLGSRTGRTAGSARNTTPATSYNTYLEHIWSI